MAIFEKVSKYADADIAMPVRKTSQSAGYDLVAAEDYIIPSVF
jgi:dUTP pyrophosphatase